jgi:small-conductance mechanosensitive channel
MIDFVELLRSNPIITKIITAIVGILVINLIIRFLQRTFSSYIADKSARFGTRRLLTFIGYAITVLFVVGVFSDQIGNLTVAFGVTGAGVAFALQEVIISVAGWIAISVGNFYKLGDRVQLGGIKGDVIDIGVIRTTLMEIGEWVNGDLYNGRIVRVANSFIFKEPVFNYSGEFPFLWDELTVPIKFGSDYQLARQLLIHAATEVVGEYTEFAARTWKVMVKNFAIEEASVAPMVSAVATDNWMEFTVRYVVDLKQRRKTKDDIFAKIVASVEAAQDQIGFASATFQIIEPPVLDVRLEQVSTS